MIGQETRAKKKREKKEEKKNKNLNGVYIFEI